MRDQLVDSTDSKQRWQSVKNMLHSRSRTCCTRTLRIKFCRQMNVLAFAQPFQIRTNPIDHATWDTEPGFGISGSMNNWIRSYLADTDRVQRVVVGQSKSTDTSLSTGVPQGSATSVLGPILFRFSPLLWVISSAHLESTAPTVCWWHTAFHFTHLLWSVSLSLSYAAQSYTPNIYTPPRGCRRSVAECYFHYFCDRTDLKMTDEEQHILYSFDAHNIEYDSI